MTTISSPDRSEKGRTKRGGKRRARARGRPLDDARLRDLALSYAARFATTGAKLEAYLARKLRERGVAEDTDGRARDLDVGGLVSQLIELGYVNDDAYARMKSRDLTARGYGARRVEQALWAAGVDDNLREDHAPGEAKCRESAMLLAKKRRIGPYAEGHINQSDPDQIHKQREKQVAAMLRAGHIYEHVRFILGASSVAMVEEWVAEAQEDESEQ